MLLLHAPDRLQSCPASVRQAAGQNPHHCALGAPASPCSAPAQRGRTGSGLRWTRPAKTVTPDAVPTSWWRKGGPLLASGAPCLQAVKGSTARRTHGCEHAAPAAEPQELHKPAWPQDPRGRPRLETCRAAGPWRALPGSRNSAAGHAGRRGSPGAEGGGGAAGAALVLRLTRKRASPGGRLPCHCPCCTKGAGTAPTAA